MKTSILSRQMTRLPRRLPVAAMLVFLAFALGWSGSNAVATELYLLMGTPLSVTGGDDVTKLKDLASGVGREFHPNSQTDSSLKDQKVKYIRLINIDMDGSFSGGAFTPTPASLLYLTNNLNGCIAVGALPHVVMATSLPQPLRQVVQEGNNTVVYGPTDWALFQSYCKTIFRIVHQFNPQNLATPPFLNARFEVGNEPDLGGSYIPYPPGASYPAYQYPAIGSTDLFFGYFTLYQHVAQAANEYTTYESPYRPVILGGCAVTPFSTIYGSLKAATGYSWMEYFIYLCAYWDTKFDFASYHYYGNESSLNGQYQGSYASFSDLMGDIMAMRDTYKPGLPIIMTEWGADYNVNYSTQNGSFNNGNHIGAAWGAAFLNTMLNSGVAGSLFLVSTDPHRPNYGGTDWSWPAIFVNPYYTYSHKAIRKAPGNLLTLVARLSGERRQTDIYFSPPGVNAFSSVNTSTKTVSVLLWNYNYEMQEAGVGSELASTNSCVLRLAPSGSIPNVQTFFGATKVKVVRRMISMTEANPYYRWLNGLAWNNNQGNLSAVTTYNVSLAGNTLYYTNAMPPSSVALLEISK